MTIGSIFEENDFSKKDNNNQNAKSPSNHLEQTDEQAVDKSSTLMDAFFSFDETQPGEFDESMMEMTDAENNHKDGQVSLNQDAFHDLWDALPEIDGLTSKQRRHSCFHCWDAVLNKSLRGVLPLGKYHGELLPQRHRVYEQDLLLDRIFFGVYRGRVFSNLVSSNQWTDFMIWLTHCMNLQNTSSMEGLLL